MTKILSAFIAGLFTAAAAVATADIHAPVIMLTVGFAAAAALFLTGPARRMRQAAARLEQLAQRIERPRHAKTAPAPVAEIDGREKELTSALVNMGSDKPSARTAARYAIAAASPAATFEDLFRTALKAPKVAA